LTGLAGRRYLRAVDSRLLWAGWLLAGAGALVGACYPNADDLKGGAGAISCAELAGAWCGKLADCEPVVYANAFSGAANCRQRMASYCGSVLVGDADSGWTETALARCASGWTSMSCRDWNDDPLLLAGPACRVGGVRAAGAACLRDVQCASSRCAFSASGTCGQCAALAAAGQPCGFHSDCAGGLACSAAGACVAWGQLGDACGDARPCLPALTCRAGACAARGGAGAPCTASTDCDLAQPLLCNFSSGVCGPAVAGTTCGSSPIDDTVFYCAANGFCNDDGSCTKAAGDGALCADETGPLCTFPTFCASTGVCTMPLPATLCRP